jgi:hypothetical protein
VKIDLIEPYMNDYIKEKIKNVCEKFEIPYKNYSVNTIF